MQIDHLSASQITTWLHCPMKYKLTYIDKAPWAFKPSALVLGTAVHTAIESWYRAWTEGHLMEEADLLGHFDDAWNEGIDDDLPLDRDDPDTIQEQGRQLLHAFREGVRPQTIIGVEEKFRVPLINTETGEVLDVALVGRFDLVETDPIGTPVIVDVKTLARRPSDYDLRQNIQLIAYAYAARRLGLVDPEQDVLLRIDVLLKLKTPEFDQRFTVIPASRDLAFFELAKSIHHAIHVQAFPPNPGWVCGGCPVALHCPMGDHA